MSEELTELKQEELREIKETLKETKESIKEIKGSLDSKKLEEGAARKRN